MSTVFSSVGRRGFLGLVAGGAVAAQFLPTITVAAERQTVTMQFPDTDTAPDGISDGDSVFGHFPPYSHPIGYGRAARKSVNMAKAAPADMNFIA